MKKPSDVYKARTSGEHKLSRSEVASFLTKKYFQPKREFDDLFETDEGYLFKSIKFFVPGKIYTFPYKPRQVKDLDYIDKQPVLLSFYNYVRKEDNQVMEFGLNLNLIPPKMRLIVLDQFWTMGQKIIAQNEKNIDAEKQQQLPMPMDNLGMLHRVFVDGGGFPFQFALAAFVKRDINPAMVRIITYEDWPLLADHIPAGNMFVGKKLPSIWMDFMRDKAKLLAEQKKKPGAERQKEQAETKKLLRTRKR